MRVRTTKVLNLTLFALASILVLGSTFVLGYTARAAHAPATGTTKSFGVFWEAWDLVDDHFYGDSSNERARTYGAIEGSLRALDDPYTLFVEPQERDREEEELRGSFGGIGAMVERTPEGRILLTPMEGRPAAEAGLLAGDELVAIDGQPVNADMPFEDVLAMVRGDVGDVVRLTVQRDGEDDLLTFKVRRAEIVTPSVSWEMVPPDIGYVRLSIFGERTSEELGEAIEELQAQGAQSFILDLRNNGGGLLPAAIDVASQFLEDGVVVYERKNTGEERPYPVEANGNPLDEPLAILVNSGSASASEIVAGAIQDYERGILIGTPTYGKASVQLIFDLSDGSSLHVTNARWLTPSRHEIEESGLSPDIKVELTDEDRQQDRDPQLDAAIAFLRGNGDGPRTSTSSQSISE
jgi:carboxyl-terminal processing protease